VGPGETLAGDDHIATDWRLNAEQALNSGRVRCHGAADLVWGPGRDWARVSGKLQLVQKLIIWAAITKGEIINEPELGCCLHNYLFAKLTESSMLELQMELEYDLKNQLPELGVQSISVAQSGADAVNITILSSELGKFLLQASREDLLNINLVDSFFT